MDDDQGHGLETASFVLLCISLGVFPLMVVVLILGIGFAGMGHGTSTIYYLGVGIAFLFWVIQFANLIVIVVHWRKSGRFVPYVILTMILFALTTAFGIWGSFG